MMNTDPFSNGNSPLHRFDPRFKLILAFLFSIVVASSQRFDSLIFALIVSLILIGITNLNKSQLLKRVLIANGMSLLLWLILPFSAKGEVMATWGPFSIKTPGVMLACQLTIKLNTLILALISLVATSGITVIGHALYTLKVPEKLVYLLLITYRYLSVLEQEYQRLARAAKIRCFKPKTNTHTYRIYGYFVGMMLIRAALRGNHVHQAMLCRGFKGKFYCLCDFKATARDWLSLSAGIIIVICMGLWERRLIM